MLSCGDRDTLLERAFRFQFEHNHSGLQQRAAAYFIALEHDRDPDQPFLDRFAGHQPPVRALSQAQMDSDRVRDPVSGGEALIFRIRALSYAAPGEATLTGGYFEGPVSASFVTLHATCRNGAWQISKSGPQKVSSSPAARMGWIS